MFVTNFRVRSCCLVYKREKLRAEEFQSWLRWLEHHAAKDDFAAVGSHDLCWCNRSSLLADIEIGSAVKVDRSFSKIHGAFGVVRKSLKELLSYGNHVVRLPTNTRNPSGDSHILVFAVHAPKCVAWERSRGRLVPSHNHSRIKSPCECHPNLFMPREIPWKIPGKYIAELLVIGLGIEGSLFLPFTRIKIRALTFDSSVSKDPS